MIQVGILGNIEKLDSVISQLKKLDNVIISGKASSGISSKLDDIHFTIPGKNKVVLIDENDVLIVEDTGLITFEQVKNAIKKDKSIFFLNYPNFSLVECQELQKLADEAQTVIYFHNPFAFQSSLQKLVKNIAQPFYLDINYSNTSLKINNTTILPFLLFSKTIYKGYPKKISSTLFSNNETNNFLNIRLSYDDTSTINLKLSVSDHEKFTAEYFNNITHSSISLNKYKKTKSKNEEVIHFIDMVKTKKGIATSLVNYIAVLKLKRKIQHQLLIDF